MDFNLYFDPISLEKPDNYKVGKNLLGKKIFVHTANHPIPPRKHFDIAIIGAPEERNSINKGCAMAPDKIRAKLYQLTNPVEGLQIADFGNIKPGKKPTDAYFALRDVIYELMERGTIPLTIGGSQDLTFAAYLAMKKTKTPVNLVSIDSRIDVGKNIKDFDSYSYLNGIIFDKQQNLLSYSNIGQQAYLVSHKDMLLMKNLFFETFRLGEARQNIQNMEPVLRDAHIISLDVNAIRQSDAPGHAFPSPNGFYSEEICQLARYCGASDNVKNFGLYETNPAYDSNGQTTHLLAQVIWFFLEGTSQKSEINPRNKPGEFKKFIVNPDQFEKNMVFYRNPTSERWWMEVPKGEEGCIVISCAKEDYFAACNNDIPERWWHAFRKYNH